MAFVQGHRRADGGTETRLSSPLRPGLSVLDALNSWASGRVSDVKLATARAGFNEPSTIPWEDPLWAVNAQEAFTNSLVKHSNSTVQTNRNYSANHTQMPQTHVLNCTHQKSHEIGTMSLWRSRWWRSAVFLISSLRAALSLTY